MPAWMSCCRVEPQTHAMSSQSVDHIAPSPTLGSTTRSPGSLAKQAALIMTLSSAVPYAPRGLSREEAARYVGVGTTKFDELVKDGRMPKPKRIDGRVVWDRI